MAPPRPPSLHRVSSLALVHRPAPLASEAALVKVLKLGDLSAAPLLGHLPTLFDAIDAALAKGGAVLVASEDDDGECAAAAVLVGWLMARRQLGSAEAPALVVGERPSALLNANFEKQLRVWATWKEFPGLPEWM